jgi:hypothetical protein
MKKQLLFCTAVLFIFITAKAQAPFFSWGSGAVTAANNTNVQTGRGVAIDAQGNVYTTGYFVSTVDFNPGSGTANLTSAGNADIFIQKLDAAGNYVWAKRMGGSTTDDIGYDIAIDAEGSVYTTGYFAGTVDFDPGSGTASLTSAGNVDIFIQKLDAAGNYVWAKRMGSGNNGSSDAGWGIEVDKSGNVYTTGTFDGTADFDPGSGTASLTSAGGTDIFIQKLDAAGNYVWAKGMGSSNIATEIGYGITVDDASNAYITGTFRSTVDFDPGSGTANLTSAGGIDVFILKLDTDGNYVWAKSMGGTNSDNGNAVTVDAGGNVYTSGYFAGTVDFDPGSGTANLTSAGGGDIFIQKLDASGDYVWAKSMGGTGDDVSLGIALDASSNVYTTGSFNGTVDFDPGSGTVNLTSAGLRDIFLQKLNSSGNYIWARQMGSSGVDIGYDIAVDGSTNMCATGYFQGTVDINPTSGTLNVTGNDYGIFNIKLSDCNSSNLANTLDNNTLNTLGITQPLLFTNSCRQIATLLPNGAAAVSGSIVAKVWIQPTEPEIFVKRHYEITPATNATTATGRVTLYFTQADFDGFNAVNTLDLPTGPADAAGKANLLIEKRGGTSGDATGLPGSYTGAITNINPADADIVWNATASRWEVSFDVTGFSGFFVKTQATVLPLLWLNVDAVLTATKQATIQWKVNETNVANYEIQKSTNGSSYIGIGIVTSKGNGENEYAFTETQPLSGKGYYRIKQTDKDGRTTYSKVMLLNTTANSSVTVYPNPTTDFVTITSNDRTLLNTKAAITDMNGKLLQTVTITQTATTINLANYPSGMYMLKLQNGQVIKLIKE